MKALFGFALFCIGLQAALSLPTDIEATHDDHAATNSKLSDPNNGMRQKLKPIVVTLLTSYEGDVEKTLGQLPKTETYDDSRLKLNTFLTSIQKYRGSPGNQIENCIWNIVDLLRDVNVLNNQLKSTEATAEDNETMRLLKENGFNDTTEQHQIFWWRFIRHEYGEDYNEDYC